MQRMCGVPVDMRQRGRQVPGSSSMHALHVWQIINNSSVDTGKELTISLMFGSADSLTYKFSETSRWLKSNSPSDAGTISGTRSRLGIFRRCRGDPLGPRFNLWLPVSDCSTWDSPIPTKKSSLDGARCLFFGVECMVDGGSTSIMSISLSELLCCDSRADWGASSDSGTWSGLDWRLGLGSEINSGWETGLG